MENYWNELAERLATVSDEKRAVEVKNIFFKQKIAPLYEKLKALPAAEKKDFGQQINRVKAELEEKFASFVAQLGAEHDTLSVIQDWSLRANPLRPGSPHLLNEVIQQIVGFFTQLNFQIVNGPEVVQDEFNFEKLNIPRDHPARNTQDSLYINHEWLLRTHCTVSTAQVIDHNPAEDLRVLSYGNVYRRDDDDATHSHQFMQIDIVWIRKDLNLANLKWLVDALLKYLFGPETQTRYRLSFFPFTEPSFEVDLKCFHCHGEGCPICKQSGWIEILGAGLLHQNVLRATDIHGKMGIAAGIGIERIAMLKYNISDIRDLYTNNFALNRQFRKVY